VKGDTAGATTLIRRGARYRLALAVCLGVLAYASLYPLFPLRSPLPDAWSTFFRPRYFVGFDFALNAVAYIPLGALACLIQRRTETIRMAVAKSVALGLAFSLLMEACQFFVPTRVSSGYDVLANVAGALVGALAYTEPLQALATRPLGALRERLVIHGPWGDAGLVLVVLWLIAQLNPALPFFEAGNIVSDPGASLLPAALNVLAVSMSVCGFALFISVLLNGPAGALRVTLLLLTVALWLKFATASIMLKPQLTAEWVTESRILGLLAGIAVFVPLRRLERLQRIYLAMLLVLAGALFSKIFGAYSPVEDLLRLFKWPHGQLASFATLTRYIHEAWPAACLTFLVALFLRERRYPVR